MEILYPMFGMIVLSGIILALFASTRVPGIFKMWGNLQFAKHSVDLHPKLIKKLGENTYEKTSMGISFWMCS